MSDVADVELPNGDLSDEDVETLSSGEVAKKLQEAWLNEKFAPELLTPATDILECMLEQIESLDANLRTAMDSGHISAKMPIHRMELERLRYVVVSYIRTRLAKIQGNVWQILANESERIKLMPNEKVFAEGYRASVEEVFESSALSKLPGSFRTLDRTSLETVGRPNLNSYVFAQIGEHQTGLAIPEPTGDTEDIVDLEAGSKHLLPYKCIMSQIQDGQVNLT